MVTDFHSVIQRDESTVRVFLTGRNFSAIVSSSVRVFLTGPPPKNNFEGYELSGIWGGHGPRGSPGVGLCGACHTGISLATKLEHSPRGYYVFGRSVVHPNEEISMFCITRYWKQKPVSHCLKKLPRASQSKHTSSGGFYKAYYGYDGDSKRLTVQVQDLWHVEDFNLIVLIVSSIPPSQHDCRLLRSVWKNFEWILVIFSEKWAGQTRARQDQDLRKRAGQHSTRVPPLGGTRKLWPYS